MIHEGEDELICDFAEYYHINWSDRYDYELSYLATLASGLRESSRIVMKLTGRDYNLSTQLTGFQIDLLQHLVWFKTKDGQKNRNRPKPVLGSKASNPEHLPFNTSEDYERKMKELKNANRNRNRIRNDSTGN
jgi:hypothetical protein